MLVFKQIKCYEMKCELKTHELAIDERMNAKRAASRGRRTLEPI